MTSRRDKTFYRPQLSTELVARDDNTSDGSIWLLIMGVKSVGERTEIEAELNS